MSPRDLKFVFLALAFAGVACGEDEEPADDNPNGQMLRLVPRLTVMNGGAAPFAATNGDVVLVDDNYAVGATTSGMTALQLDGATPGQPPAGYTEWSLTSSTGFGPAAGTFATTPAASFNGAQLAFFNPAGQAQLGVLQYRTESGQGTVLNEAALTAPLNSSYPSAMVAGNDGLWVADSVFGPGSSVRHYGFNSFSALNSTLSETTERAFVPVIGDVNGDSVEDFASLGKMVLVQNNAIGLVAFSFLAPAPAGAAGGILAFDTSTGQEIGRVVLPISATSSTALEFVGGLGATNDYVVLTSAQKSAAFEDTGGVVALYKVESWLPFQVVDADANAPFDQPESFVATSKANPVGLTMIGSLAMVVNAPFFQDGSVDLISVRRLSKLERTAELGPLYTNGFSTPGDPRVSSDGRTAYIPSEAGLLRVGLSN